MSEPDKEQLLEIYRLHAELADRVSQRREGANRLYGSLLLALVVFLAAVLRFGTGTLPLSVAVLTVGLVGVALSLSWFLIIRSYRQLNAGKHEALAELEDSIGFAFFKREWELLGEGKKRRRYWALTRAEAILPGIFAVLFGAAAAFSLSLAPAPPEGSCNYETNGSATDLQLAATGH